MQHGTSPRRALDGAAPAILLLCLLPAAVAAQPAPVGPPLPVTGVHPRLSAFAIPGVATADDGRFAVVWVDGSGRPDRLVVSIFAARGAALAEVVFDDVAPEDRLNDVAVATGAGETFVVAWVPDSDRSADVLQAQWLLLDGSLVGERFEIVRGPREGSLLDVRLCADRRGNAVAAWNGHNGISLRRFDLDAALGEPRRVAGGRYPEFDLACTTDGRFASAWVDENRSRVRVQVFAADGSAAGPVLAASPREERLWDPKVALGDDGRLAVMWARRRGERFGMRARFYDASGQPLGTPVGLALDSRDPLQLVARADGTYSAFALGDYLWEPLGLYPVLHQDFSSAGRELDEPALFSQGRGASYSFTFGHNAGGDLTMIWEDDLGLYARSFNASAAGAITFSRPRFVAVEESREALLIVRRTGGSAGEVSADFATRAGTASPGNDFHRTLGTVSFADRDSRPKTIRVPLLDDDVPEATESFALVLARPTGGASLGEVRRAVLELRDGDRRAIRPAGPPVLVTGEAGYGGDATVALQDGGELLVAWGDQPRGVMAQRFSRRGAPREGPRLLAASHPPQASAHHDGTYRLLAGADSEPGNETLLFRRLRGRGWRGPASLHRGPSCASSGPSDCDLQPLDASLDLAADGSAVLAGDLEGLEESLMALRADRTGNLLSEPLTLYEPLSGTGRAAVASQGDGDALVAWRNDFDGSFSGLEAVFLPARGNAPPPAVFPLNEDPHGFQRRVDVAALRDGRFLAVWESFDVGTHRFHVVGRLLTAEGVPEGGEFPVSVDPSHHQLRPRVAGGGAGTALVVWETLLREGDELSPRELRAQLFDSRGVALGAPFEPGKAGQRRFKGVVAANLAGDFALAWHQPAPTLWPYNSSIHVRRFAPSGRCVEDAFTLCLWNDRFQVRLLWDDPRGPAAGVARATEVTRRAGSFSFDDDEVEVTVEIVDGRGVNGHFWVSVDPRADAEFSVVVTDTGKGRTRTYRNPPFKRKTVFDVEAFPARRRK